VSIVRRIAVVGAVIPTLLALAAVPAAAGTETPGVAFDVTGSGLYRVVAACQLSAGYTTDPRYITYVVEANAHAEGPSPALATGVTCTVYSGGTERGGASGSLPGNTAVAVGQAIVPVGQVPTLCVSGGATYLDGKTISQTPCP
jgi:hypothetical protein